MPAVVLESVQMVGRPSEKMGAGLVAALASRRVPSGLGLRGTSARDLTQNPKS